jgi:hypothetical protein
MESEGNGEIPAKTGGNSVNPCAMSEDLKMTTASSLTTAEPDPLAMSELSACRDNGL